MNFFEKWQKDIAGRGRKLPRDVLKYGIGIQTDIPEHAAGEFFSRAPSDCQIETEGNVEIIPLSERADDAGIARACKLFQEEGADALAVNFYFAESFASAKTVHLLVARRGESRVRITGSLKNGVSDILFILAREGAQLDVFEDTSAGGDNGLSGRTVFLFAEKESILTHAVSFGDYSGGQWFYNRIAIAEKGSAVVCAEKDMPAESSAGGILKSDTRGILLGEGASFRALGILSASGARHRDSFHGVRHRAGESDSELRMFGVARAESRIIYRGMIAVPPEAGGVSASQKGRFFLESPHAQIDAIPALEIEHPDTKTEHALSISSFDEKNLAYPRSRGISEDEARALAAAGARAGFLKDALRGLPHSKELRQFFDK